jgi:hypothetical protein
LALVEQRRRTRTTVFQATPPGLARITESVGDLPVDVTELPATGSLVAAVAVVAVVM